MEGEAMGFSIDNMMCGEKKWLIGLFKPKQYKEV